MHPPALSDVQVEGARTARSVTEEVAVTTVVLYDPLAVPVFVMKPWSTSAWVVV